MATVETVIDFALKFGGTKENPAGSNRTQFGEYYGLNGVAWCAQFVYFVLDKNGIKTIKSAYTPAVAQYYADMHRGWIADDHIKRGDLVFFDFKDSVFRIQHIGFALGPVDNGLVSTIEGNTSSGSGGSQDNGGGVFVRRRAVADIVYNARPLYEKFDKLPRFDLPKARTYLQVGDKGADVRTLQKELNAWMRFKRKNGKPDFDFGKIKVDGVFSIETRKALKTFQMQYPKLETHGIFARETERKLEAVREWQEAA